MYLGIDIGTSAVKAVIMADEGNIIAQAQAPLYAQSPHIGWSEQHPEDWWAATLLAMSELKSQSLSEWQTIKSIGLSGQMHGAVILDADGRPLRPAILWNDGRSAPQCAAILDEFPQVGQLAGVLPMPGFTAPKIRWIHENEPDLYAKIAHILLPKDYIRLKLTSVHAMDMCDAAGTLWLDEANRCWSDALCDVSKTKMEWLPKVVEGTEITGTLLPAVAHEMGLSNDVTVVGGGGDAGTGAIGIGAVNDGDSFISLGTSGQLFVTNNSYRPNPESALHAFAHCVPGRWFQMAAMLNGASPMQWFANVASADIGGLLKDAEALLKERIPFFIPYLTGERTPHNDADIRAGFYGLDPLTGASHMMAAVVDAIAYSFCDAKDALAAAGPLPAHFAAIGGGAQSDYVLQNMADAMGIGISRYQDAQSGPAFGAARLAAIGHTGKSPQEIATKPDVEITFTPRQEYADYHSARLKRYRAMYHALKDV